MYFCGLIEAGLHDTSLNFWYRDSDTSGSARNFFFLGGAAKPLPLPFPSLPFHFPPLLEVGPYPSPVSLPLVVGPSPSLFLASLTSRNTITGNNYSQSVIG